MNVLDSVKEPQATIVVYTSDHGDALGEHGLPFKGPFFYEPLISDSSRDCRTGSSGGSFSEEFATSADIAPTVASLAGLKWPGRSTALIFSATTTGTPCCSNTTASSTGWNQFARFEQSAGSFAAIRRASANCMTSNTIPRRLAT